MEKSVELRATPGGGFLHEPVGHLLLTGAATGTLGADVVDDVGEAADVAEVGLKTSTERHQSVPSLRDDDDLVVSASRSKLFQLAVLGWLWTHTYINDHYVVVRVVQSVRGVCVCVRLMCVLMTTFERNDLLLHYIRLTAFFPGHDLGKPAPERQTILDFTGAREERVAVASSGP